MTRPWISARSNGDTVAVSGRPSSLARFVAWGQCSKVGQRKPRPLQIFAPYHAPHLFSRDDVGQAVHPLHPYVCKSSPSAGSGSVLRIPLISSTTGDIVEAANHQVDFEAVLESAVEQILLQPIRWDPVLATLQTRLQTIGGKVALRVVPVATTADQLIYTGLQQQYPTLSGRAPGNNGRLWATAAWSNSPPNGDKIAIIGMAGRFPEAASTDALWDILRLGLDVSKEIPPLRWNIKTHVDLSGRKKNSCKTSLGCWLNDPDVFDADFFGISAQEATRMDPAQRLALMTTYEAIEQAGIVWPCTVDGNDGTPSTRPGRVGVYCGVSGNDWREFNAAQKIDSHYMRASNRAFVSGRITETFNFSGPSLTIDTSSSNSLAPVQIACRSLWAQETDVCIVGGADVMTNPDVHTGLDRAGLLSRSGNCKVFDETADGFCRGEGVVSLVLKRLDDALAEHDTILGVIAGTGTGCISASPPGDGSAQNIIQKSLFTEVLNRSNVDPESITYAEMDGSSTKVGDASEVACAVDALAPISESKMAGKSRTTPLYLGSAMANIGDGEATSGLSSIIKVLLMFRENIIPPHIGIHTRANSEFPVELAQHRNVHVHTGKVIRWDNDAKAEARGEPKRAIVHDLGTIARANSALILEEPPLQDQELHERSVALDHPLDADQPTSYIITISAKSKKSLHRNTANLYLWLQDEATRSRLSLAQLSYTTTARRNHYSFRTILVVSSAEDLCAQLFAELQRTRVERNFAPTDATPLQVANTDQAVMARPIVFAFTGSLTCKEYFSQLYESFSCVRRDMDHLEQIVRRLDLPSVMKTLGLKSCTQSRQKNESQQNSCIGTNTSHPVSPFGRRYPPAARCLGLPSVTSFWGMSHGSHQLIQGQHSDSGIKTREMAEQLAHMCSQIVLSRLWRSWGIHPVAAVSDGGVNIYSALNVAGVLSDADAIYLAGASIELGLLQQTERRQWGLEVDFENAATAEFEKLDTITTYHKAEIPVLTLIAAKAGDEIPRQKIRPSNARLDVLSRVGEDNRMLLSRHLSRHIKPKDRGDMPVGVSTEPDLIAACRISDVVPDQCIMHKMGPQAPTFLAENINDGLVHSSDTCNRFDGENATQEEFKLQMWSHLTETLRTFYHAGAEIRWNQFYLDIAPRNRRVISNLPAYSWDLKEYWVPYVNDWTLHKGDVRKAVEVPKLESTTIHTIIEETELVDGDGDKVRLVVEADISRHDLHGIVQGHVVDGVPLCTPVCDIQQWR